MTETFYRLCKQCHAPNEATAKECSRCHTPMPSKATIFLSYSHKDKKYAEHLLTHLSALRRSEQVEVWYDKDIDAGRGWAQEIDGNLLTADVILLLISASFLNSDYCYSIEAKCALERYREKNACVIPVLIRPVDWDDTPFHHIQAVPRGGKPVQSWPDEDAALLNVVQEIKNAITNRYGIAPKKPAL